MSMSSLMFAFGYALQASAVTYMVAMDDQSRWAPFTAVAVQLCMFGWWAWK